VFYPQKQQQFLSKPLAERQRLGRQMRAQSEAHKATARANGPLQWHDLDTQACLESLEKFSVNTMIHGHTHHPATHDLGAGKARWVLSDWDVADHPPRAQVLRLSLPASGCSPLQRIAVASS
jgi:UDP-2,3-diacylglucosamine hydrolase